MLKKITYDDVEALQFACNIIEASLVQVQNPKYRKKLESKLQHCRNLVKVCTTLARQGTLDFAIDSNYS